MSSKVRCGGCGKPLRVDSEVVQIKIGPLTKSGGLKAAETFATLHRLCFHRSIESPDAAMDEIQRLAKVSS